MPPKRLDTLTMGLPSVFHTAPPQSASKARLIWSPVFVGGALASQNGLGLLIPQKSMERSAISLPSQYAEHVLHRHLRLGRGVHHFLAAVDAVAAAPHLRVA